MVRHCVCYKFQWLYPEKGSGLPCGRRRSRAHRTTGNWRVSVRRRVGRVWGPGRGVEVPPSPAAVSLPLTFTGQTSPNMARPGGASC